jgi:uncharacterized repeat protein (TIGR03803 family)
MRSKMSHPVEKAFFAICLALLLTLVIIAQPAQAQNYKFKVLHTFHGKDGAIPAGLLARDSAGNLYGTTSGGGTGKGLCASFFLGCGTAFKLNANGKLLWSHSFNFTNGADPLAGLNRDSAGSLYGTAVVGGDTKCNQYGCGTVFELDPTGKEKILHKFKGGDGMFPEGVLAKDSAGNLYGTTQAGGLGNIFKIDRMGSVTVLYTFTGEADGCYPIGLILDGSDNLYGVTTGGGSASCGSGYGVVFELDAAGKFSVLHTFGGGDGAMPDSILLFDSVGNLYGTTNAGGDSGTCQGGCGTVFKLAPNENGTWTESVLYSFCSAGGCADGLFPERGPLAIDAAGNLYGTTGNGGTDGCGGYGCGVVYRLDPSEQETVLYKFTGGKDGAGPFPGVVMDQDSNLYGVAARYGDTGCKDGDGQGCGVVFKLSP